MNQTDFAIFLNGSYGVGKTSTLGHVGDLLAEASKPFSLMDVDWFHRSWPPGEHDSNNTITGAANMALVWQNYRRSGPRQLVVSGVLATSQDHDRYEAALDMRIRPIRLVADESVIQSRLHSRYTPEQEQALSWHLDRYRDLSLKLAQTDLDEATIDTSTAGPRDAAAQVLRHFFGQDINDRS